MSSYKIGIITLLWLFASSGFAANKYITGEGRFYSKDDDSLSFVKKQLLYSAYKNIITKELSELGLDSELFWKKIDDKFTEYFIPIKESLIAKYKMDNDKISYEKKKRFQKIVRAKKLKLKARYGKIGSVISSYSIKRLTRSTQVPNARYIRVSAKLNRRLLNKIYVRFTTSQVKRIIQNFYVTPFFHLENTSWPELGVEVESDFRQVVIAQWRKWLGDKFSNSIQEFVVTSDEKTAELSKHFKLPQEAVEDFAKIPAGQAAIFENKQETPFLNSFWLKIVFKIKKSAENTDFKKRKFEITGEYVLIDLNTNTLIDHFDFPTEKRQWSFENNSQLSSNAASLIYRMPLEGFKIFHQKINTLPINIKRTTLEFENINSVSELLKVSDLLSNKGITKSFLPSIKSYKGSTGTIELRYSSKKEEMIYLLKQLHKYKVDEFTILNIMDLANPFRFRFEYKERPLINRTEEKNSKLNIKNKRS